MKTARSLRESSRAFADDPRRDTRDDRIGRNILCHERAGGDNSAISDRHAGRDDRLRVNRDVASDLHGCGTNPLLIGPLASPGNMGVVGDDDVRTDQEQEACSRDVQRLCRKLMDQGDFTILACLKENRPKLSPACRYVLVSHGQ